MNGNIQLPQWKLAVGSVVTTVIGAILTALLTWGHAVSAKQNEHDVQIGVLQEAKTVTEKSIDEIKGSQRRIEDKLDRMLERSH
jgi:hypothetical protein